MALGFVRPARPAEAGEIARLQLATWRVAYRRMLPRRVLDDLDQGFLAARWAEAIGSPPSPRHRVLVAVEQASEQASEQDDPSAAEPTSAPAGETGKGAPPTATATERERLAGFAAFGPADELAAAPGEAPLAADVAAIIDLLVEPRWGRRGHGSRLLAASVAHWRADGFHSAVAWAYEQDPATRAFFGSAGWEPDGATRALDVDDLLVPQLRLHTRL